MGFCVVVMFCYSPLCNLSRFTIILMGKKELVALPCLSSWCLVIDIGSFSPLRCVIVIFPDHTHLFFVVVVVVVFIVFFFWGGGGGITWHTDITNFVCFI